MTEFARELQKPWSLEELRLIRCDQVSIRVSSSLLHEYPETTGRNVLDVMSYPEVISINCEAEFNFTNCVLIRVWDEFSISTIERITDDIFEGDTFRRFQKSGLLTAHADTAKAQGVSKLYHYELICDSIIDVLCTKAPTVVIREISS